LAARLAAGVAGCAPGGCLLQVQLSNLGTEAVTVTGLACPSSRWRLCQGSSDFNLQIAPDASAALHRQLMPAADVTLDGTGAAADAGAGAASRLSDADAGLLEASRQAAAAVALTAPKQPPAQQHPQRRRQQQQKRQQGDAGLDVVLLWQAAGKDGAAPRTGFCCLHNLRWVHLGLHPAVCGNAVIDLQSLIYLSA
jgi:hypothetical protein